VSIAGYCAGCGVRLHATEVFECRSCTARSRDRYETEAAVRAYEDRRAIEIAARPRAIALEVRCHVCGKPSASSTCEPCDRDYYAPGWEDDPR
jgi:hypothetical protein